MDQHGEAMMIFQRDLKFNADAHVFWEVRSLRMDDRWQRLDKTPNWHTDRTYRYRPSEEAITAAKPKPERTIGSTYWMPNPLAADLCHEGEWMNSDQQQLWDKRGLICSSRTQAVVIADAMITLALRK